ncbi:MAG: magnesium chelatase subunit H [Geminicoccaceae bacterium]
MPKRISAADPTPVRVVIITLDRHGEGAIDRARAHLVQDLPGLSLDFHAASTWNTDQAALERCRSDIERADLVLVNMLFMEDHIQAVLPWLQARRSACDAIIAFVAAGEVIRLTRMGGFSMDGEAKGALALLKRLRGSPKKNKSSGRNQVAMLRRLPKILRFIPGTAQDVRAYFLTMQYWLSGSDDNMANMVRFLVSRYADGPRRSLRGRIKADLPTDYPDVGLYHPRAKSRFVVDRSQLPKPAKPVGTVGLLLMRSYVLADDTAHYDAVIEALERRGLAVVPAFAAGLDARPAVENYFLDGERPTVDAVLSLTGFSLVGGPAYNDSAAAQDLLRRLDVPYLAAHALEFQSLESWQASERGLLPVEATMMVAIPELDGATGPVVFGGRGDGAGTRAMEPATERLEMLASRVEGLVRLRMTAQAERKLALVIFNFPPNAGSTGTAAFLSVFESLFQTLKALAAEGYQVDLPASVDDLRARILDGNAATSGTDANVLARIPVDDHVRREPHLEEIEKQWGPAPGRQLTDGRSIQVLGAAFGNVIVTIQPSMGYEGDPMRLLFEGHFAPTHAFSAFYRYLREDFSAHAVLHFGTHGALEFMPGKQVGLDAACWPDRLIGALPNFYLYAANNPSEGTIAKRRSAATLVSYMTPPLAQAGLYRGLLELKASLDRWRTAESDDGDERARLADLIRHQATELDLVDEEQWDGAADGPIERLSGQIIELEHTLIPHGLHVVGAPPSPVQRAELLDAMAEAGMDDRFDRERLDGELARDTELPAILHALGGGFTAPAPGGDLLRNPSVLPTGRNLHGFDPFLLPSAFAVREGAYQADLLIDRHRADGNALPETIALVLWGTDNLKSEGGPIAQVLALVGAKPRFDTYGRLTGAELIPLEVLGRPRIDVLVTLSGIFRDLLPLQTKLLAEAAFLAASADEPSDENFVRKHALAYQERHGCDLETAALRVFSNADGAYGSNVNHLIDSGAWADEDELAETYTRRKCFAYGRDGRATRQSELLGAVLGDVELAYQNLESVELGVTTIGHYFDTLGGIGRAVRRAKGDVVPVYIGDQTRGSGKVRSLSEQVALEARTRMLNPKWYEGMLEHGYEGVRQIEAHVTNTMGWSATTGQVEPWVYQQLTQTFVLDEAMRKRLAELNPKASTNVANRLLEAHERQYWTPAADMLEALKEAGEELEDRLEGIGEEMAA